MKAAVLEQFGDPASVLTIRDRPVPEPGRGQVRVRMLASPINPSDLLTIQGLYGQRPAVPFTPGYEGVGVVEASGGGLLGWRVKGRRVAVINNAGGNWAEYVVIPARQAVPVPDDLPDEQVASFFVNPATALAMTTAVLKVRPGEWLLQTAAGSALGRMVIRLGKALGFRTINVVRRKEQIEELKKLGADAVVSTSEGPVVEEVKQLTGGAVLYALECVGGDTGRQALQCLAPGGRMLVYGTLSLEPIPLDPRDLILGQKRVEGFWLGRWARQQGVLSMLGLFRRLTRLIRAGVLATPPGPSFPLDQVQEAVREAARPGHSGKVLLRISQR